MAPDPASLAELLDSMPSSSKQCSERDAAAVAYSLAMAANQLRARNIFHLQQSPQDALLFCPNSESDVSVIDPPLQTLVISARSLMDRVGRPNFTPQELMSDGSQAESDSWVIGAIYYYLLSSRPPIETEGDPILLRMAREEGMVDLYSPPWSAVYQQARLLAARLLRAEPDKRATPNDILADPWVQQMISPPPSSSNHSALKAKKKSATIGYSSSRGSGAQNGGTRGDIADGKKSLKKKGVRFDAFTGEEGLGPVGLSDTVGDNDDRGGTSESGRRSMDNHSDRNDSGRSAGVSVSVPPGVSASGSVSPGSSEEGSGAVRPSSASRSPTGCATPPKADRGVLFEKAISSTIESTSSGRHKPESSPGRGQGTPPLPSGLNRSASGRERSRPLSPEVRGGEPVVDAGSSKQEGSQKASFAYGQTMPPLPMSSLRRSSSARERPPVGGATASGALPGSATEGPTVRRRDSIKERVVNKSVEESKSSDYMAALASVTLKSDRKLLATLKDPGKAARLAELNASWQAGSQAGGGKNYGSLGRSSMNKTLARRLKDEGEEDLDVASLVPLVQVGDLQVGDLLGGEAAGRGDRDQGDSESKFSPLDIPDEEVHGEVVVADADCDDDEGSHEGPLGVDQSMIVDSVGRRLLQSPAAGANPRASRRHGRSTHVFC